MRKGGGGGSGGFSISSRDRKEEQWRFYFCRKFFLEDVEQDDEYDEEALEKESAMNTWSRNITTKTIHKSSSTTNMEHNPCRGST